MSGFVSMPILIIFSISVWDSLLVIIRLNFFYVDSFYLYTLDWFWYVFWLFYVFLILFMFFQLTFCCLLLCFPVFLLLTIFHQCCVFLDFLVAASLSRLPLFYPFNIHFLFYWWYNWSGFLYFTIYFAVSGPVITACSLIIIIYYCFLHIFCVIYYSYIVLRRSLFLFLFYCLVDYACLY